MFDSHWLFVEDKYSIKRRKTPKKGGKGGKNGEKTAYVWITLFVAGPIVQNIAIKKRKRSKKREKAQ